MRCCLLAAVAIEAGAGGAIPAELLEFGFQISAGAVERDAGVVRCQAEFARGVLDRGAVEIDAPQQLRLRGRQCFHQRFHAGANPGLESLTGGDVFLECGHERAEGVVAAPRGAGGAVVIDDRVAQKLIKPRDYLLGFAELAGALQRLDEAVLQQVLGLSVVADPGGEERFESRALRVEDGNQFLGAGGGGIGHDVEVRRRRRGNGRARPYYAVARPIPWEKFLGCRRKILRGVPSPEAYHPAMKFHTTVSLFVLATGLAAVSPLAAQHHGGHADAHAAAPAASAKGKLLKVSEVDAAWLAEARKNYALTVCAVSEEDLGGMGEATEWVYRAKGQPDRLVKFCCDGCIGDFLDNPAAGLARIDAAAKQKAAK